MVSYFFKIHTLGLIVAYATPPMLLYEASLRDYESRLATLFAYFTC